MKNQITSKESTSRETHTHKLSRMKNELSVMLTELHSYRCEPCTPAMHEQYLELDNSGRKLKYTINRASDMIKDSMKFPKDIGDEIVGVMKKYRMFQKKLYSYRSEAIAHH
ncbi:hypothetical protein [Aquimarina sp. 2201CG14-23]|uniref:hypothetical protein n=1 Tax=Aquimarina mycalae TaxID=3040073 RepID=UPI002477FCE3|nr:hypothetical protein [Aquimarina sp. 2201CG14-23]MDH7446605.1 hypothetical protein [Aquimarina sp. 2201CG14-23]